MFRRGTNAFILIAFVLGLLSVRILSIDFSVSRQTASMKSTRKNVLSFSRGFIYDRYSVPLVNEKIYDKVCKIGTNKTLNTICVDRYSDNQLCAHLIGYLSFEKDGVSGIEKSYDRELKAFSGEASITYSQSATGEIIGGIPEVKYENFISKGGIVLTVDKDIQLSVEKALDGGNIDIGAAVVLDVKTSEILAMASRPVFNPNNIENALKTDNSPLVNRALSAYSVGSVFKPVIAAAVLEKGVSPDLRYTCTGKIQIGDTVFNCHKSDGHGETDLYGATSNSCNTYYINLTKDVDSSYLLSFLKRFNIDSRLEIADLLYTDSGILPDTKTISDGEKANLSFGQGRLTASPVHMAAIYASIANNGIYTPPIVIKSMVDGNTVEYKKAAPNASYRVMSERTAGIIMKALEMTVEEGSGKNAKSEIVNSAGKTATAQSGWYRDGEEITHSWFIGIFPVENPKYVVCIIKENGKSGSADCAPVYKIISELITAYE